MDNGLLYDQGTVLSSPTRKGNQLLRLIRASQPIMRSEIADRLSIDKSTVTEHVKPLIAAGILREESRSEEGKRRSRYLSFADTNTIFAGLNLGVSRSQVGLTSLTGGIDDEIEFETPDDPKTALRLARERRRPRVRRPQRPPRKAVLS